MWTDKLEPPGKDSGHAVDILPTKLWGQEPYCYLIDQIDAQGKPVRNKLIDPRILVVQMIPGGNLGAAATVGFSKTSLNIIEITPGPIETTKEKKGVVLDIAHEIGMSNGSVQTTIFEANTSSGHVFGLRHEHQRANRDEYVHFNCSNLQGYEKAIQEIKKQGNKHTIDEVCDREDLCKLYKFGEGEEYAKKQYIGSDEMTTVPGKDFDFDSIM